MPKAQTKEKESSKESTKDYKKKESSKEASKKESSKKGSSKEPKKGSAKKESTKKGSDKKGSKSKKESKNDRYAGVEKGDAPNIKTAWAELSFNVIDTAKWLKKYFTGYQLAKKVSTDDAKKKDDDSEKKESSIRVGNTNFAFGVVDECLCSRLGSVVLKKTKKNTVGLFLITEENLMDSIRLNKDLNFTFGRFLDEYDSHSNYESNTGVKNKDLHKFLEKHSFDGGNVSVQLEKGAYNLLQYCMLKSRNLLAELCYHKILYAKKQSLDPRSVLLSLPDVYTGELLKLMTKKVETMINKLKDGIDKDDSEESEKDDKKKSKDESDAEESDKEESDKEESDKEESDKEESDKEESDKEESDKEDD